MYNSTKKLGRKSLVADHHNKECVTNSNNLWCIGIHLSFANQRDSMWRNSWRKTTSLHRLPWGMLILYSRAARIHWITWLIISQIKTTLQNTTWNGATEICQTHDRDLITYIPSETKTLWSCTAARNSLYTYLSIALNPPAPSSL